MKHTIKRMIFVLGLGAAASAGAQSISANLGAAITNGTNVTLGATLNDVTSFGGNGVSLRGQVDLGQATALSVDGLVNFPAGNLTIYAGPGVVIANGGVTLAATAGISAPVADRISVFGEGGFRFSGTGIFRAGVSYRF